MARRPSTNRRAVGNRISRKLSLRAGRWALSLGIILVGSSARGDQELVTPDPVFEDDIPNGAPPTPGPDTIGEWGALSLWPTVPVHMHLLPDGRVMFWDRDDDELEWDGNPRIFDPETETFEVAATIDYDIFCAGHSFLADGRLLVTGGHVPMPPAPASSGVGEDKASIYDPATDSWHQIEIPMNAGRWYPSNVTLSNGDVLVLGGTITTGIDGLVVNPLPQVWQAANELWRDLTNALQGGYPDWADFYPFTFQAPDGRVFVAGPQRMSRYLDVRGTGEWTDVAESSLLYRYFGSSVMYDDGKVLVVGGNPRDSNPTNLPSASAEVIDLNDPTPAWRTVPSMSIGRRHLNTTLLPDGKVLVSGGTSGPSFNEGDGAVLYAEMWDPLTETWSTMAGYTRSRVYHSNALLLPDGRVLGAGGGHPAPDEEDDQPNAETFSPPYLFKGPRPVITGAPSRVDYGSNFSVLTAVALSISHVNWIRLSSVTHAFNQNQRINRLNFFPSGGNLLVTAPSDPNLCPPGHYMLFILNEQGVPSIGHVIQIGPPESSIMRNHWTLYR